ncbi:MAG TPA: ATP-binding protein [Myxococcaceae bacterium]|jgi:signal transduction histidine kinase/CheY-like chemotaxis protein
MPSASASPASRRLLTWAVATLPVLVFGAVVAAHQLPAEVQASSIDLAGKYKQSIADDPSFSEPALDASKWKDIDLPMFVPGAQSAVWARRTFTLPPSLDGKPLYFMAGGFWPGTEVWLNGRLIGSQDLYTRGEKAESFGAQGWEVPAGLVHSGGDNVLALRMTSLLLWDSRLILGAREPLRAYFLLNSDLKRMILHGQLLLLAFFAVLVAVFYRQEEDTEEKARYGVTLHLLAASVLYTSINVGVGGMRELTPLNSLLIWLSIIYFTGCLFEWMDLYVLHRRSRARLVFRALYAVYTVLLVGLWVAGRYPAMYQAWPPIAGSLLIPLVWATVKAVRGSIAHWKEQLGPIVLLAMVPFLLSTLVDILGPLGQMGPIHLPRLTPIGTANVGVLASVLIVGDFLRISYENKDLTASLSQTNSELAVALARANESVRLKGEFVANVSHELRTPLNAIVNIPEGLVEAFGKQRQATCASCGTGFELSAAEQVDAATECPECHKKGTLTAGEKWTLQRDADEIISLLDLLKRSGRSLLQLVDNVLDFSRLDAGKMSLALDEVSVEVAVAQAVDNLKPLAAQHSVDLRVETVDPAWKLRADPVKMTQVLVNLVGNAIKFSPEKTAVTVGARFEAASNSYVFFVRDQGVGVPSDAQALIFETFRQADGSHTRRFGGTGLGLSIARQLVEMHDGQIWVESEGTDHGSTFLFRLPRGGPRARRSNPALAALGAQSRTILVVDDDPVAIEATRLALRPLGHRVVGLSDPRRFIDALEKERPDVMIMEAVLARMSPLTLLQKVRASERSRKLPVIVASELKDQKDAFVAHGASWLTKPWTAEQLLDEVRRQMARAPAAAPPPTPQPLPASRASSA